MDKSFLISNSQILNLSIGNLAQCVFVITSRADNFVRVTASIVCSDQDVSGWLVLKGAEELGFAPGETKHITATIEIPTDTPPGMDEFRFGLEISSADNPDELNAVSEQVLAKINRDPELTPVIETKPASVRPKVPPQAWIFGGAAIAALLILGFVFWPASEQLTISNLVGDEQSIAKLKLETAGFKIKDPQNALVPNPQFGGGIVIAQNPRVGTQLGASDLVTLTINPIKVAVPENLIGASFEQATEILQTAGLNPKAPLRLYKRGKQPNEVIEVNPASGTQIDPKASIQFTVNDPSKLRLIGIWKLKTFELGKVSTLRARLTKDQKNVEVTVSTRNDDSVPAKEKKFNISFDDAATLRFQNGAARYVKLKPNATRNEIQEEWIGIKAYPEGSDIRISSAETDDGGVLVKSFSVLVKQ